jgi:cytochrome c2
MMTLARVRRAVIRPVAALADPCRRLAPVATGIGGAVLLSVATLAAEPRGDPEIGRMLFADKLCARCHIPGLQAGVGPALEMVRRSQGEMQLAARLWNHVPAMTASLRQGAVAWPRIDVTEMTHLMAFLGADASRDPPTDQYRGHGILVRKGCLKCHSLRGEGGRIQPDLASHRADYESAAAWAASMWAHSGKMAAMASRLGIAYPRFEGDEMADMLAFLRSVAAGAAPGETPTRRQR